MNDHDIISCFSFRQKLNNSAQCTVWLRSVANKYLDTKPQLKMHECIRCKITNQEQTDDSRVVVFCFVFLKK